VRGWAAPETKTAADRARLLIEEAEAVGEEPDDPLLLYSALYGVWAAHLIAFNGSALRNLAAQVIALAGKQGSAVPLMIGHRLMGMSLLHTGDIAEGRTHFDRATSFYRAAEHRQLATRFGQDLRVAILCYRSLALWMLGFPETALADTEHALKDAREIGHAATLMYTLGNAQWTHLLRGKNDIAKELNDELAALSDEKSSLYWKSMGIVQRGLLFAVTDNALDALQTITSGLAALRLTGSTWGTTIFLPCLASVYAELGQFDDARRCIREALASIDTTGERWFEAEVNRVAGEVVRRSPQSDAAEAETYLERAMSVARQQQAKSWELRAAMSMARLCAIRVGGMRLARFSLRCTAGVPKGSTRAI
jgi:predicted ATPase